MKKIIIQIILTLLIFAGFFSLKILIFNSSLMTSTIAKFPSRIAPVLIFFINNWLDVVAVIFGIFLGRILVRLIIYVGQHFLKKNK
jgi:hypothetical protein